MSEKKNARIEFRVTQEEKEELTKKAAKARQSLSQYILTLSENKKIIVIDGVPELVKQIVKIGVNVNQIATIANTNRSVDDYYLKRVGDSLDNISALLGKLLKKVNQQVDSGDEIDGTH